MNNLYHKIRAYLDRDFTREEIRLQNDGDGDYISYWSDDVEKSKPTDAQLDALDAQATTLESNNQVDGTRRTAYGSWNDQLDEIYHDIDTWKARLQTIKTNNPKS